VVNDPAFVRTVLQALGTSDAIDVVVVYAPGYMLDRMADALAEASRQHRRLFVAIDTGLAQSRAALREAEVAVFEDLGLAVAALAPSLLWCEARAARRQADQPELDTVTVPALPCNEAQARAYVAAFGVPEAATGVARSADEAVRDARRVGYPVAVKVLSPDIAHKTEAGGVALNLADDEAVRAAWADVTQAAARAQPGARIDGVMVQKMERGVAEIIVGATRDPVFGPVLTVGLGGVLTEIYQDTSHRLLPVDEDTALQMLRELKAFALLDGFRGKPRGDVAAACQRIVAIGNALLAAPAHVSQIEVNPLLIKEAGQGVAVLDALILPATP
jgi:acyl-CoA synthetase (NDP forming)